MATRKEQPTETPDVVSAEVIDLTQKPEPKEIPGANIAPIETAGAFIHNPTR